MLLWTVICLAIAVHFNNVLIPSDLSEYHDPPLERYVEADTPLSVYSAFRSLRHLCLFGYAGSCPNSVRRVFLFNSSRSLLTRSRSLGSTFLKRRSPVSTRVELLGLGLIGVLWLGMCVCV